MISGIGSAGPQRMTDMVRAGGAKPAPTASAAGATEDAAPANPAALMAAEGPPIDSEKVGSIKAAIANGTYAVDPRAIADRMIALDMPAR